MTPQAFLAKWHGNALTEESRGMLMGVNLWQAALDTRAQISGLKFATPTTR